MGSLIGAILKAILGTILDAAKWIFVYRKLKQGAVEHEALKQSEEARRTEERINDAARKIDSEPGPAVPGKLRGSGKD